MRTILERLVGAGLRASSRSRSVPLRGTHRVRGLVEDVVVRFDAYGVPHIAASTDADAFLAHGYCHALERFFQMDILRRALCGRLTETVGERSVGERPRDLLPGGSTTLDADRFLRSLDLARAARRYLASVDTQGRALLDAYVHGVNAALVLLRRRRPLEHRLLGLRLEPWTGLDSLVLAKGLALTLSFKWRTTPVYQAIAERLGDREGLLQGILPPVPGAGDPAVMRVVRTGLEQALAFLPFGAVPAGSNAFVVGGARSASGLPLLASDPHLELGLPSIWYLSALHGPRYQAVGCSMPGLPGVVIGRTPTFAWGLTNGMIDDGDFWAEEVDGTGTRYRVDGQWRPLSIETHEIRRRGAAPVLARLRRTHRGPIITDGVPGWTGAPLSLRLALHDVTEDLQTFLGIGRARCADDALAAAAHYGAPVQNLLYADTTGRCGMRLMGRIPIRAAHPVHPGLVRDGTDSATDWTGWVEQAEMPHLELEPEGAVVSANDPQVDGAFPYYLSHLYEPPYRGQRLRQCLAGRVGLTIDDLARVQIDSSNVAAGWFRDLVLAKQAESVRRLRPSLGPSIDRLMAWDGIETADSTGAALWHLTYHHLLRRTFGPTLEDDLLERWLGCINLVDAPLRRAFEDPDSPWAPPGTRATLVARALEDAERDLKARGHGPEVPWGAVHDLTLRHPVSDVPILGAAFTRGPMPLRGSPFAPSAGQYRHQHPAAVVAGASYRQVVDLASPATACRMVTYGGQSGDVASKHYDDLTPLWLAGEGIPMRLEEPPTTGKVLRLEPA